MTAPCDRCKRAGMACSLRDEVRGADLVSCGHFQAGNWWDRHWGKVALVVLAGGLGLLLVFRLNGWW